MRNKENPMDPTPNTQTLASAYHDARHLYNALVQHSNVPDAVVERAGRLSDTIDALYHEACRKELAERTRQVLATLDSDEPPSLFQAINQIRQILDSFNPF